MSIKDKQTLVISKSAQHLNKSKEEANLTEFEVLFWRTFYSFKRWQEDCQNYVSDDDVNAEEIALMHLIRTGERSKTLYEIARLMNRDDMSNIQYSIKKLLKLKIIQKSKSSAKKVISYEMTERGNQITDRYSEVRSNIISHLIKVPNEEWETLHELLKLCKNAYDEAARIVVLRKQEKPSIE